MQLIALHNEPVGNGIPRQNRRRLLTNLRWFTPGVEVKLCGHATLAATHALLKQIRPDQ